MNKLLLLALVGALFLTSCSIVAQPQLLSDSAIQTAIAQTQAAAPPTATLAPTATPLPTETPIPTETPEPTPLPTEEEPVLTPTLDFSGTSVITAGYLNSGGFLVTIQLTFTLEGEYWAIAGGEEFTCQILDEYPDRLYCNGPELPPGKHTIRVFPLDQEEALFELEFTAPGDDTKVSEPPGYSPQDKRPKEPKEPKPEPYPGPGPNPYP